MITAAGNLDPEILRQAGLGDQYANHGLAALRVVKNVPAADGDRWLAGIPDAIPGQLQFLGIKPAHAASLHLYLLRFRHVAMRDLLQPQFIELLLPGG